MTDPGYEIRDAIYNALNGTINYTIDGVVNVMPVYSVVAHTVDYPYVVIHPTISDNAEYTKTETDDIHEITIPIECITGLEEDAQSYEVVNRVMDAIIGFLVKKMLPMQNYNMLLSLQQSLQEFKELTDTHQIIRKSLVMKYIVERK